MLKKLAKYGNSTALVIDKAILEILEIEDGGVVKLQTDGRSLIITPVKAEQEIGKISYGAEEGMQAALNTFRDQRFAEYQKYLSLGDDQKRKLQKDVSDVMLKYQVEFEKFTQQVYPSQEYQNALSRVAEQYDPIKQSADYVAACAKVKYQFCPELEKMDQELAKMNEVYSESKK